MTDMTRSDEEKSEARMDSMYPSVLDQMPDVPTGLCICLTEKELEKLDLDSDAEVGDLLHGMFMAKVTSISKHDSSDGARCRIEMAVTHLSLEDEDTEEEDDD